MKRHKWISTGCLTVVFSVAVGLAWSVPQDQQQTPSTAEVDAYQAARSENDTQAKLKLLDDLVTKYPHSALLPEIYRDYYQTYFAVENYPQVINYADKLLDFGDKVDVDSHILALVSREVAYSASCGDPELRTPQAYEKARDAGRLGLQLIGQWQKPENVSDEQFAAGKNSFSIIFHDLTEMAESGLLGLTVRCLPAPSPDRKASPPYDRRKLFDRMIDELKTEQRESPQVR
jgi:hypothetical protein